VLLRSIELPQYLSHDFRQLLQKHHITQSLSRPAQCWDNSVAEAWFGIYKLELIEGRSWRSMAQLRAETLLWIEGWYNLRRRHSSLRYLSPVEFEHHLSRSSTATQAA
jgi:putative transposase